MTYYMGYSRNAKGIECAIEKLKLIESHAGNIKAANLHELMRAHESMHLLKHCQLSALGCSERKESGRTLYTRTDYPDLDAGMNRCLVQWQEKGKQKIAFESLL